MKQEYTIKPVPQPGLITGYADSREVWFGEMELDLAHSLKIRNHSPDGFAWGYGGSGPAQLALALMLLLIPSRAEQHYQQFKWDIIAVLPKGHFQVPVEVVTAWLRDNVGEPCGECRGLGQVTYTRKAHQQYGPAGTTIADEESTQGDCQDCEGTGYLTPKRHADL